MRFTCNSIPMVAFPLTWIPWWPWNSWTFQETQSRHLPALYRLTFLLPSFPPSHRYASSLLLNLEIAFFSFFSNIYTDRHRYDYWSFTNTLLYWISSHIIVGVLTRITTHILSEFMRIWIYFPYTPQTMTPPGYSIWQPQSISSIVRLLFLTFVTYTPHYGSQYSSVPRYYLATHQDASLTLWSQHLPSDTPAI